ncbi:MAG: rhamnogalacturonan acetylesterase [Sediminibacterium sp.]|nr:rhamnogalacturonan acetylesterase [Sediminibacterium sp.]
MKKILYILILINIYAFDSPKVITLWLCGDSTMADKQIKSFPETGWGTPFKFFWDSNIIVKNLAKNGRSTRSFINEGLWSEFLNHAHKGDVVFIQFGHNDESIEKKERYTTPVQFKTNLMQFIQDARLLDVLPILMTPVSRRKFDSVGNAVETHPIYSQLVREVALTENVTCIDLDKLSKDLYQQLGAENSKYLFLMLAENEHPNYPKGKIDNTHFNELGARLIAQLVLKECKKNNLAINKHIINNNP